MEAKKISIDELTKEDFDRYEDVRLGGRWNMFASQAIRATGLGKEKYLAVLRNYSALKRKYYPEVKKE